MADLPHRTWTLAEDYRYLENARRADFAWEWLRRDPRFRRLELSTTSKAADGIITIDAASAAVKARWGCLNVPDCNLRATGTPVLWSAAVDSSVLQVTAVPAVRGGEPAFDVRCHAVGETLVVQARDREHLMLRWGSEYIRLDVVAGSLLDGPVTLRLEFMSQQEIEPAIAAMRRFLHLHRTGRFPDPRPAADQGTRRLSQALRVHDALADGASIRDIGVVLFGADRVQAEWLAPGEALKSHSRRLIALSRDMAAGGYKTLLSSRRPLSLRR